MEEDLKRSEVQNEVLKLTSQAEWERSRWLAANVANSMGAKLHSVYALATFPWEKPPPVPTEDILSRFPKTLN